MTYENVWKPWKVRLWFFVPGPMPRSTWEHCASGVRAFSPSTSALKLSRCLAQIWKAYHKLYDYMSMWQHNFAIFGSGGLVLFGCFMSCNVFRTSGSRLVHPSDFLCCPFYVSDSRKKSSGVIGQRSHATAASTTIRFLHLNRVNCGQYKVVSEPTISLNVVSCEWYLGQVWNTLQSRGKIRLFISFVHPEKTPLWNMKDPWNQGWKEQRQVRQICHIFRQTKIKKTQLL
jgi:hypothetical protein